MTDPKMPIVLQCELANISRATYYANQHPAVPDAEELLLLALIDEEYTRRPFYGSCKMVAYLLTLGHFVNVSVCSDSWVYWALQE